MTCEHHTQPFLLLTTSNAYLSKYNKVTCTFLVISGKKTWEGERKWLDDFPNKRKKPEKQFVCEQSTDKLKPIKLEDIVVNETMKNNNSASSTPHTFRILPSIDLQVSNQVLALFCYCPPALYSQSICTPQICTFWSPDLSAIVFQY